MNNLYNKIIFKKINNLKTFGDWGLGIGDWGLGIGDWAQSPIPNPHFEMSLNYLFFLKIILLYKLFIFYFYIK